MIRQFYLISTFSSLVFPALLITLHRPFPPKIWLLTIATSLSPITVLAERLVIVSQLVAFFDLMISCCKIDDQNT